MRKESSGLHWAPQFHGSQRMASGFLDWPKKEGTKEKKGKEKERKEKENIT